MLEACAIETEQNISSELLLNETLVIEDEGDQEIDMPFLGFAGNAIVDTEGNIYIYDSRQNVIQKFDSEGNHLQSIGREGEGPGEFQNVTAIFINSDGHLMTADRENARITVFNAEGEVLNNHSSLNIRTIGQISELPGGRYLLVGWHNDAGKLVHITDANISKIESSLVAPEDFADTEQQVELNWLQGQAGYVVPLVNGRIIFVPKYYAGSFYLYENGTDENWALSETISGYRSVEPPVNFSTTEPQSADRLHGISFGPEGQLFIEANSLSHGLYQTVDALYHLSYLYGEEVVEFVIEKFDLRNFSMLSYASTDTLNLGFRSRQLPRWIDEEGRMYLTDNEEGVRLVRYAIGGLE